MKPLIRKSGYFLAFLLIGVFALVVLRGPSGLPALMEKRRAIQELQEQNATLAADNERKKVRIEKLKHDRDELELEIRKRLKLIRPGETQFIVPETPEKQD